jgi:TolB-like protein/DNA-binding winged helix-turn-helix (wHTH) protein
MRETATSSGTVRFGTFEVDLRAGELRKQGVKVKLQEQPFQVLQVLLERPGEVVTREDLRQRIWPADTFVDFEGGVNNAVKRLREALGDKAETPRYIETLPRRGYRFIGTANGSAPSTPVNGSLPTAKPDAEPRASRRTLRTGFLIGLGFAALLLAIVGFTPNDWWQHFRGRSAGPLIRSIAVLPLQNLSGDPAQEYFADAMTEELITELSRIRALKVISRTSVMRYKKTDKSLPEIARELNVDAIVEGSVLRSGERVRITAQLIYASKDTNLWAQTYDNDLRDVLTLQGTVAGAIAKEVKVEVTPQEQWQLKNARPVNRKALDAYLEGQGRLGDSFNLALSKAGWPKRSEEESRKALAFFQQAIQEDPNYAPAYVGLSQVWQASWLPGGYDGAKAKAAAEKALALDDTLVHAHLEMAYLLIIYDRDWTVAEKEYKRILEITPGSAEAHEQYARYLDNVGRREQGLREHEWAQQLDPDTEHIPGFDLSPSERVERQRFYIATHPPVGADYWDLANKSYKAGMYKEALDNWTRVMDEFGWTEEAKQIRQAYSPADPTRAAKELAKEYAEVSKHHWLHPETAATFYAALNDRDHVLAWLERGFAEHDPDIVLGIADPPLASLRSDPRFQDLVRRAGLPPPP